MQLVDAKCPNCGAMLKVEKNAEAAVCQYCNSAYIVEKAINNYNTYITNSINIDSDQLLSITSQGTLQENIAAAKRARLKEVWDEAENSYRIIEKKQPENIEAIFYSEFSRVKQNLKTQDVLNRHTYFESLNNAIKMMPQYQKDTEEEIDVFKAIYHDMEKMYSSQYVINVVTKGQDTKKTNNLFKTTSEVLIDITSQFYDKCKDEADKEEYRKLILNYIEFCKKHGGYLVNAKAIVSKISPGGVPNKATIDSSPMDPVVFWFITFLVLSVIATIICRSVAIGGKLFVITLVLGILVVIRALKK